MADYWRTTNVLLTTAGLPSGDMTPEIADDLRKKNDYISTRIMPLLEGLLVMLIAEHSIKTTASKDSTHHRPLQGRELWAFLQDHVRREPSVEAFGGSDELSASAEAVAPEVADIFAAATARCIHTMPADVTGALAAFFGEGAATDEAGRERLRQVQTRPHAAEP